MWRSVYPPNPAAHRLKSQVALPNLPLGNPALGRFSFALSGGTSQAALTFLVMLQAALAETGFYPAQTLPQLGAIHVRGAYLRGVCPRSPRCRS
jgi:hypothetical protein